MTVYLNLPEAAATAGRKDAVVAYLKSAGLAAERVAVKVGPNPASARPASLTAGTLYEGRPEGTVQKSLGAGGGDVDSVATGVGGAAK